MWISIPWCRRRRRYDFSEWVAGLFNYVKTGNVTATLLEWTTTQRQWTGTTTLRLGNA